MKALGFQPVDSTSLSRFWFSIVNLHPYTKTSSDTTAPLPDDVVFAKSEGRGEDDREGVVVKYSSSVGAEVQADFICIVYLCVPVYVI